MTNWDVILRDKKPLILPTETVYGLFADALDEEAVNLVYTLKNRPKEKAMNLNVATLDQIYAYSSHQPVYLDRLFKAFLPGPLTIILRANDKVPHWINSGLETVGFRVPNHPITQEIIASFGPLIGPSANVSGKPSGRKFGEISQQFKGVQGYADDFAISGVDSTIIDLSGNTVKILRQGVVTKENLQSVLPDMKF